MAVGPNNAGSGLSVGRLVLGLPYHASPCLCMLVVWETGHWDPRSCSGYCNLVGACVSLPFWISAHSVWLGHCRSCKLCFHLGALDGVAGSPWQPVLQDAGVWCRSHRWLCQLFGCKKGRGQKKNQLDTRKMLQFTAWHVVTSAD